jgi:HSP20 family molecular chaperone IbpA
MSDNAVKTRNTAAQQGEATRTSPVGRRVVFTPQADILEKPEAVFLYLDLPGVKSDGVEVNFERGELAVKARRETRKHPGACLVEEFEEGDFYRAFLISQDIAADQITAELKNGVLTVFLPRSPAAQPRRINVKGS